MSGRGDPRERFTGAAATYARARPDYPAALVDWILEQAPATPDGWVVDLGCGTGISTRLLAARRPRVVGVDPNADMLSQARARGGARFVRAAAEATGLAGGRASLVLAAQAFHWFDRERALDEMARLAAPGGRAACLWNLRGTSPFMDGYDRLLQRFSSEYEVTGRWREALSALLAHPRVREARVREARHEQRLDLDGLLARSWSSSYVFRAVADRAGFDAALRALFEEHAREGLVAFPYDTSAVVFVPGPPAVPRPEAPSG